ncbi:MAG TPA: hypothetical protein DEQ40_19130 [Oxalobacteraceae bacterium]|jgi:hypothetical protein|nr:hypothetical protein [Oxalobacteraceae bacterium]
MKTLKIAVLAAFASVMAFAQTNTLTQTTLSAAVLQGDSKITLTSATGVTVPNANTAAVGSLLYVYTPGATQGEAMIVQSLSGTVIKVFRGRNSTAQVAHNSGDIVLIGNPNWFYSVDPKGGCTTASTYVTPYVNIATGYQWLCSTVTSSWIPGFQNPTADIPNTAVASANGLITPSGPLFHLTGTAAITGFTVPIGFVSGNICAIPDGAFTTTNANNIAIASTGVVSKPLCWTFDTNTAKFYPSY